MYQLFRQPLTEVVSSIRKQIEQHTPSEQKISTSVDLPLSDECTRILADAAEEADQFSHKFIGTEHLFLGILRESTCFADTLLRERGVSLDRACNQLGGPEESTLYRPVGQAEFELVRASGFKTFPPRLPHQPIFYPVLSAEYATQIARDWNPKDEGSGFGGYVLRFKVRTEFLQGYQIHVAGSSEHQEYWIPAEDLEKLNENIVGAIEVISEFHRKG